MVKQYKDTQTPLEHRDCWRTPKFVFDYYNKRFDLRMDVASSDQNKLCDMWLTEEDNALSVSWSVWGNWCNPPYSDIKPWVEKAVKEMNRGCLTVMLIPADTSVKWFKLAYDNCTECHFISGRLAFINAETQKPVSGNNKGSVVFIFDPKSPVKQSVHLIDRDSMK